MSRFTVIERSEIAELRADRETAQRSLCAVRAFAAGDVICSFSVAANLGEPERYTIQTGRDAHVLVEPHCLRYVNHSCDPNVFFDMTRLQVTCLRPIQVGDELRYFYPSTEWKIAEPFECSCGADHCLKQIGGAAQLPVETLKRYRMAPFIKKLIEERIK